LLGARVVGRVLALLAQLEWKRVGFELLDNQLELSGEGCVVVFAGCADVGGGEGLNFAKALRVDQLKDGLNFGHFAQEHVV
jgi:hypothetical protein